MTATASAPRIYTTGPVHTDDVRVGDVIDIEVAPSHNGPGWSVRWGPVLAIRPYVSSVAPHPDWRYAVFANGVEITMIPGATWFPQ